MELEYEMIDHGVRMTFSAGCGWGGSAMIWGVQGYHWVM